MSKHFDAIIIGTGQAGPPLAERFAAAGMTVAIIERHKFGGTCVNTGCIPTKTLVASAYATQVARRGAEYGFTVNGEPSMDRWRNMLIGIVAGVLIVAALSYATGL